MNDDTDVVGVDIGIAIPADDTKDAYVVIKVTRQEMFFTVNDARDIALSIAACATRVEQHNEEKDHGSIQ